MKRNYHSKVQTNYRLRPEAISALQEVAKRTGRSKTEVVEYAVLKLASAFPDLAGDVQRALLEVILRDLHDLPTNTLEELRTAEEPNRSPMEERNAEPESVSFTD